MFGSGCGVYSGFRMWGVFGVEDVKCIWGSGCGVYLGFRMWGVGFQGVHLTESLVRGVPRFGESVEALYERSPLGVPPSHVSLLEARNLCSNQHPRTQFLNSGWVCSTALPATTLAPHSRRGAG